MMTENTEQQFDELEAGLMRAGRDVHMSSESRDKTLAALGLGATGVAVAATSKASLLGSLSGKSSVLLLIGGAVGVVAVVATVALPTPPGPSEAPEAPALAVAPSSPDSGAESPEVTGRELTAPATDEPAEAERASTHEPGVQPAVVAEPTVRQPPKPASASALTKELEHIGRVETALRGGQSARALSLLSDYRKTFPRAQLGLEAELLTIQALAQSGNSSEAARRAERFVRRYPSSPLAARARKHTLQDASR